MEKKGLFYWVIYVLLVIWQLPQYLAALVMWPFLGTKTKLAERHFNTCYMGEKMSGGISLGPIAYVSTRLARSQVAVAHELDGHTVQSKILGPLYLIIIGIPSILNAAFKFTECYYDFYTEAWANKCAKINANQGCRLMFNNINDERNKPLFT